MLCTGEHPHRTSFVAAGRYSSLFSSCQYSALYSAVLVRVYVSDCSPVLDRRCICVFVFALAFALVLALAAAALEAILAFADCVPAMSTVPEALNMVFRCWLRPLGGMVDICRLLIEPKSVPARLQGSREGGGGKGS